MTTPPLVSILMPVRDGERWLREAIDSVQAQTFGDFELIAIDDGSVDATPEILAGYAGRDERIRVLRHDHRGLVFALNQGLAEARGKLIARLDADDVALPERLARQVEHLKDNPDTVLLGAWADEIDEDGSLQGHLQPEPDPTRLATILLDKNPFVHSSMMFPLRIARTLGGYRTAFEAAEDHDLWLRMAETGKIANLPQVLIGYRVHRASVTRARTVRQLFSTRLAGLAARERRRTGRDPADQLDGPPDWNAAEADTSFFADAARIARFLVLADPDQARATDLAQVDLRSLDAVMNRMTHRERRVAQYAIANLLARSDRPKALSRLSLLARLIRLHPPRAAALLWNGLRPVPGR